MQNNRLYDSHSTSNNDATRLLQKQAHQEQSESAVAGVDTSASIPESLYNTTENEQNNETNDESQEIINSASDCGSLTDKKIIKKVKTRKNLRAPKRKKTQEEVRILEAHFNEDPSWGRKTVKALKSLLPNLTVDQIYKWGYDKKLLEKKRQAQETAKNQTHVFDPSGCNFQMAKIDDFNLEVDALCEFHTGTSDLSGENLNSSSPTQDSPKAKEMVSTECLPNVTTMGGATIIQDDPFFYEGSDDAFVDLYITQNNKVQLYDQYADVQNQIPEKRDGKRRLFRVPSSSFVNMDFYTYQEEVFVHKD